MEDDLGIFILSDECELIEQTVYIMKYVWFTIIVAGVVIKCLT